MTEQDRITGENIVYESLGPKNKPGLTEDLGEKILVEISRGTTQISIVLGKEVLFGTPSRVEKRKQPRYGRKEEEHHG